MDDASSTIMIESRLPTFFLASAALVLRVLLGTHHYPYHGGAATGAAHQQQQGLFLVVLLWLTACVQRLDLNHQDNQPQDHGNGEGISIYAHLLLFNIFLYFGWQILCASRQARRFIGGGSRSSRASYSWIANVLTACSLGFWAALLVETFLFAQNIHRRYTILTAISTTLVHLLYQWDRQRRQAFRRGLTGLPLVTSHNNLQQQQQQNHNSQRSSSLRLHEKEWYHWNVYESLQWMSNLSSSNQHHGGGHHDEASLSLVRVLGPQGLTCRQLLSVSATELHRITQLPLGIVLDLLEQVQNLHEQSPCPPNLLPKRTHNNNENYSSRMGGATTTQSMGGIESTNNGETSWLDRYDAEYSHKDDKEDSASRDISAQRGPNNNNYVNTNTNNNGLMVVDDHNVMADRAQSLMKDRFGLELPEIRNAGEHSSSSSSSSPSTTTGQQQQLPINTRNPPRSFAAGFNQPSMVNTSASHENSSFSSSSPLKDILPPDFLASMPPHIAAIAQQKPDLVQKILESKTKHQQAQQQPESIKQPPPSTLLQNLQRVSPVVEERQRGDPPGSEDEYFDNEYQDDEDEYDGTSGEEEGERTELLRQRRKKPPPQVYQSTSWQN